MLLLLASLAHADLLDDIYAGTGYTAQDLCTRTFVSGDRPAHVRHGYVAPEVQPLPWLWWITRGKDRYTVVSVIPGHGEPRTSIYRPGLGCTLIAPGSTVASVLAQPFVPATDPAPTAAPWPVGEGAAEVDPDVAAQLDPIFALPATSPGERSDTTALLVAKDGRLVYERYAPTMSRAQPQLGWSMTKSLTAMIAGLFVADGRVGLEDPVGLRAWAGSPAASITWRHLLNMAAGLQWTEDYGAHSDVTTQLFAQADQGGWTAARPVVAPPGTVFNYSTGLPVVAMVRLRELLGGDPQAVYDLVHTRLFAPLGIRGAVISPDASGTPSGGSYGVLRPVDWLRLGELLANAGRWGDTQVLPTSYVDFLRTPSPADPTYGGCVWFPAAATSVPKAVLARLPSDTFFFWGHLGQFTIVSPSAHLVMLRMGVSHGDDEGTLGALFAAFGSLAVIPSVEN